MTPEEDKRKKALEALDSIMFSDGPGPVCAWVNEYQRVIRQSLTQQCANVTKTDEPLHELMDEMAAILYKLFPINGEIRTITENEVASTLTRYQALREKK